MREKSLSISDSFIAFVSFFTLYSAREAREREPNAHSYSISRSPFPRREREPRPDLCSWKRLATSVLMPV